MWIGHVAPALFLRPYLPAVPLSVLFLGCASADCVGFVFSLLGIEQFRYNPLKHGVLPYDFLMPYSHSLLGMTVWALLYASIATILVLTGVIRSGPRQSKSSPAPSWISIFVPTVLVTISHWLFEIPVHRTLRDGVPLVPEGSIKFGWGWFEYQLLSNALEFALFLPAVAFYFAKTRPATPQQQLPWYSSPKVFVVFCVVSQLMVCAAPHWFYKHTPDTIMLVNGLVLMAAETGVAHMVDRERVSGAVKTKA